MSVVINKQFGYQPWTLVNRLHRDIERSIAREFGANSETTDRSLVADSEANNKSTARYVIDWTPPVDVRETKDAFVLVADLPGVNPQDIEVTTENGVLTIKGVRQDQLPESNESQAQPNQTRGYQHLERATGQFLRRFTVPEMANVEAITAKSANGVLTLTLPKRAEVQPRRIEIQAA